MSDAPKHYHKDSDGFFHACYHRTRGVLANWQFWMGMTVGYPFEHYVWEHVRPFTDIMRWLGL